MHWPLLPGELLLLLMLAAAFFFCIPLGEEYIDFVKDLNLEESLDGGEY
jgi:hypothetical protein